MKAVSLAFFVAIVAMAGDPIEGKWTGQLKIEQDLRLLLKVVESEGELSATLDSLDQGAMGLAVDTISAEEGQLVFKMSALAAGFEGQLNQDLSQAEGQWSQGGKSLPLTLVHEAGTGEGLLGNWNGTLEIRVGLTLNFNLKKEGDVYTGTLDSPDQSAMGIPFTDVSIEGVKVLLKSSAVAGSFEGELSEDGSVMVGTWNQGGQSLALQLTRQ